MTLKANILNYFKVPQRNFFKFLFAFLPIHHKRQKKTVQQHSTRLDGHNRHLIAGQQVNAWAIRLYFDVPLPLILYGRTLYNAQR